VSKNDFDKVNTIINESIDDVMKSLQEKSTLLNSSENLLVPAYSAYLSQLIQSWRNNVWLSYEALVRDKKSNKTHPRYIECDFISVGRCEKF